MTKKISRHKPARAGDARTYFSPDVLGRMQSLLAALADLDCAYESDLDTVRSSDAPEVIRQAVIRTLEQQHQNRRAHLVRQLEALQERALLQDQTPERS